MPDCSNLCRRQKSLTRHIPCRPGTGAVHLLIDSTGVKAEADGAWLARRPGPSKPRDVRKVHLGIDADTLEMRAIEITGSRIGDAPVLPGLLDQIPGDQALGMVAADGACDTRACHAAIATRGAAAFGPALTPAAQELLAMEGTHGRSDGAQRHPAQVPPPGPAIWKRWTSYHRRSLVEARMRSFKLLGERIMSRAFDRQVAELEITVAILNRFTALALLTPREGEVCPGKGKRRPSMDLRNRAGLAYTSHTCHFVFCLGEKRR